MDKTFVIVEENGDVVVTLTVDKDTTKADVAYFERETLTAKEGRMVIEQLPD